MAQNRDRVNRQVRRIEDRLQVVSAAEFDRRVNSLLTKLETRLNVLQQDFFSSMANSIVGASGPPKLGSYTPFWKPLADSYTDRRELTQDVPEDEFFVFSGSLGRTLGNLNPITFLGRPVVSYQKGKFKKRPQSKYKVQNHKDLLENMTAHISIDLFPRLSGSINQVDEANLFDRVKITERRGKKSTTTPLAYRLKNYQGGNDRPVVVQYLNWWLSTRARKVVRETIRR